MSRSSEVPLPLGHRFTPEMFQFDNGDPILKSYERPNTSCEENFEKWVSLYLKTLGSSKPSATLTTPIALSREAVPAWKKDLQFLGKTEDRRLYCQTQPPASKILDDITRSTSPNSGCD
ncbi:hypothetical protein BDF21DRAFT_496151 [Thamnidium elegans]|nr:hypothetical protein BDF21DRAFT_496151 [Thamnidium elegans]